jgi:hypothetical protein
VLDVELNTQPAITYLAKVTHRDHVKADAHGEHGAESHDAEHAPMGREKASKEQLEKDSAHKAEAH